MERAAAHAGEDEPIKNEERIPKQPLHGKVFGRTRFKGTS